MIMLEETKIKKDWLIKIRKMEKLIQFIEIIQEN